MSHSFLHSVHLCYLPPVHAEKRESGENSCKLSRLQLQATPRTVKMLSLSLLHLCILCSIYTCLTEAKIGSPTWDSAENETSPVVSVARALFQMWGLEPATMQNICLHCDPRCQASCGSRRFRRCCYHFMRRKRGSVWAEQPSDRDDDDRYNEVPSIKQLVSLWQSQQL